MFCWLHDFVSLTGCSSKIHDSTVSGYSDLSRKLPSICGDEFHLLGDSAYAISLWLLTPFRHVGNITRDKQRFNNIFSETRGLIENASALIKQRFRQILHMDFQTVNKITRFLISVCVLHNICIDANDLLPFGDEEMNRRGRSTGTRWASSIGYEGPSA